MDSFKNILIPTDFSKNSALAYEFSLNFIKKKLSVLHVLHVLESSVHSLLNEGDYILRIERERILNAEEEMERFINKYSNAEIEIKRIIRTGKACEEIIKYVKESSIDIIIIATHGWTNLSHLLAGNVTKKVLKFSTVPVICVKTNVHPRLDIPEESLAENWVG
ncbi:MAG TPA: universal stress protein [Ignavibacteriaceae bacterium]|nr:universal stress protein [Ignavibacteriaceae bacterium]